MDQVADERLATTTGCSTSGGRTPSSPTRCRRSTTCSTASATAAAGRAGRRAPARSSPTRSTASRSATTRGTSCADRSPNLVTTILQTIVGARPAPTRWQWFKLGAKHKLKKVGRRVAAPFRRTHEPKYGTERLKRLFLNSAKNRMPEHPRACATCSATGLPPLGEHEEMFRFVSSINRDVTQGIADAINNSIDDASFTGLFDSIGAVIAQQFVLMPYYFAVFHQNKERHLLREITRQHTKKTPQTLRVGLFTDTLDDVNGVGRFIRDMAEQAHRKGHHFTVHTSTDTPKFDLPNRKNFVPLLSRPLPYYADFKLHLPPVLEILEWADRQQFDAIHISTPGPMGLCGWLASKMLRVPLVGTYHTDFPAYIDSLTGDHRIVNGAVEYFKLLYGQMSAVFSRSRTYRFNLRDLGVRRRADALDPARDQHRQVPPAPPRRRGVRRASASKQPRRVLYAGRVSVEKNLPLLVDAFKKLAASRRDTALVVAGDGPYLAEMKAALKDCPAYFLGFQSDAELGPLYASSDLFVFPSRTDTLGQVVMEAQASGLPVLVSDEGGPKETIDDGLTGLIVPGRDARRWCAAMEELLQRRAAPASHGPDRPAADRPLLAGKDLRQLLGRARLDRRAPAAGRGRRVPHAVVAGEGLTRGNRRGQHVNPCQCHR